MIKSPKLAKPIIANHSPTYNTFKRTKYKVVSFILVQGVVMGVEPTDAPKLEHLPLCTTLFADLINGGIIDIMSKLIKR